MDETFIYDKSCRIMSPLDLSPLFHSNEVISDFISSLELVLPSTDKLESLRSEVSSCLSYMLGDNINPSDLIDDPQAIQTAIDPVISLLTLLMEVSMQRDDLSSVALEFWGDYIKFIRKFSFIVDDSYKIRLLAVLGASCEAGFQMIIGELNHNNSTSDSNSLQTGVKYMIYFIKRLLSTLNSIRMDIADKSLLHIAFQQLSTSFGMLNYIDEASKVSSPGQANIKNSILKLLTTEKTSSRQSSQQEKSLLSERQSPEDALSGNFDCAKLLTLTTFTISRCIVAPEQAGATVFSLKGYQLIACHVISSNQFQLPPDQLMLVYQSFALVSALLVNSCSAFSNDAFQIDCYQIVSDALARALLQHNNGVYILDWLVYSSCGIVELPDCCLSKLVAEVSRFVLVGLLAKSPEDIQEVATFRLLGILYRTQVLQKKKDKIDLVSYLIAMLIGCGMERVQLVLLQKLFSEFQRITGDLSRPLSECWDNRLAESVLCKLPVANLLGSEKTTVRELTRKLLLLPRPSQTAHPNAKSAGYCLLSAVIRDSKTSEDEVLKSVVSSFISDVQDATSLVQFLNVTSAQLVLYTACDKLEKVISFSSRIYSLSNSLVIALSCLSAHKISKSVQRILASCALSCSKALHQLASRAPPEDVSVHIAADVPVALADTASHFVLFCINFSSIDETAMNSLSDSIQLLTKCCVSKSGMLSDSQFWGIGAVIVASIDQACSGLSSEHWIHRVLSDLRHVPSMKACIQDVKARTSELAVGDTGFCFLGAHSLEQADILLDRFQRATDALIALMPKLVQS